MSRNDIRAASTDLIITFAAIAPIYDALMFKESLKLALLCGCKPGASISTPISR